MAVQFSQKSQEKIQRLLERYPTRRAVMLPALHLATQEFPYIDDDVCQAVADLLHVPHGGCQRRGHLLHHVSHRAARQISAANVHQPLLLAEWGAPLLRYLKKSWVSSWRDDAGWTFYLARHGMPGGV